MWDEGEGVAKKVVSCRRGLEAFMANLLGMGEAFGEGVTSDNLADGG